MSSTKKHTLFIDETHLFSNKKNRNATCPFKTSLVLNKNKEIPFVSNKTHLKHILFFINKKVSRRENMFNSH